MIIGIIGGGQLGMMMAEEAVKLGHSIISLDPNETCSIVQYASQHITKNYNDKEALAYLNENCDVLTYEFENVDLDVLKQYINKLPQKTDALRISRNRLIEKDFANQLGIKTPKYFHFTDKNEAVIPSIIKTTTGGYDGKGQYVLMEKSDIDQFSFIDDYEYICEEFISFDYEISIVATRDRYGEIAFQPTPKNIHKNGILHISIVDQQLDRNVVQQAQEYTKKIMNKLEYVGTLAVEYFVKGNDVIFNEFAPRPHNSGHYSMDGCTVSQFKNHILAITGDSVVHPTLVSSTVMINVLGQNQCFYERAYSYRNAFIHDYNKNSDRENRKIGHINYLYNNETDRDHFIERITKENHNGK